jgi:hypothetical protein
MKLSLVVLIALLSLLETISSTEDNNSILDYETNDSELDEAEWTTSPTSTMTKTSPFKINQNDVSSIVHEQLQTELRKLKSSITDELMEELITYYGKKFSNNDALKEEIDSLTRKLQALTHNFNSLGNNYKSLSANHRNLVDVVRNNLIRIKKERRLATSRRNIGSNSNTRALSDKKVSIIHEEIPSTVTQVASTKTIKLVMSDMTSPTINDQISSYEYDGNNRIVRHEDTKKNLVKNEKGTIIKGNKSKHSNWV